MKPIVLGIAVAGLLASGSFAIAQTARETAPPRTAATTTPAQPSGTTAGSAASGDSNQAVATTSANATTPAKGANSFTMAEAKSRIEKSGFANVGDLTKDDNGVWHGNAQKGSGTTMVWLDYKGNVGESK